MEQDTEGLSAPEDKEFPSDEELLEDAEWTRDWEWPEWLRVDLRAIRSWRPDPRTFVAVLALVVAPAIVQIGTVAGDYWRTLTTTPVISPEVPAAFVPRYTWDRVLAGAELLALAAAVVIVVGAVVVALRPRRLPGYVVVVIGLTLWLATEVMFTAARFGLDAPFGQRAGDIVSALFRTVLLGLAVRAARSRPAPAPAPSD